MEGNEPDSSDDKTSQETQYAGSIFKKDLSINIFYRNSGQFTAQSKNCRWRTQFIAFIQKLRSVSSHHDNFHNTVKLAETLLDRKARA